MFSYQYLYILLLFVSSILKTECLLPTTLCKYPNGIIKRFVPFVPNKHDIREPIIYIPKNAEEERILGSLNGFYGLLTPDMGNKHPKWLIELFMGDGYIQGVFFYDTNITFCKTYIQTEKIAFFKNPLSIFHGPKVRFPNLFGVANTAFLHISSSIPSIHSIYTLFERDKPYEISVDIPTSEIKTIGRMEETPPTHFLAHPKYNKEEGNIETLDYRTIEKKIYYYRLEENLKKVIQKIMIPTRNMPIIHDFVSLPEEIILIDSSYFSQKAFLIRCNKRTLATTTIPLQWNFYIFHYSKWRETDDSIEIYASLYDTINMFSLNISGKYRKITIDKRTNEVLIEKNAKLEGLNLDFPLPLSGGRVLLRSIDGFRINGFVICMDLEIIKTIVFPTTISICGEPSIIEIDDQEYIIFMTYDCSNSDISNNFIIIYRICDDWKMEIPVSQQLAIGFHSIFVPFLHKTATTTKKKT